MTALHIFSKSIVVGLAATIAACATAAPPTERMEASAGAIRAAEEVGAARVPRAALYLQLAHEQSEHARLLIAKATPASQAQAASLLARAQADAELALTLARESEERALAQKAIVKLTSLRQGNQNP
jgi:hypothetical protein